MEQRLMTALRGAGLHARRWGAAVFAVYDSDGFLGTVAVSDSGIAAAWLKRDEPKLAWLRAGFAKATGEGA